MKTLKDIGQLLATARQLEEADDLSGAARLYEQVIPADPLNQQAVARLLGIYRHWREYKKELRLIERVLAAYKLRDKSLQKKWISDHPHAARVGQKFLKSIGGASASAFGSSPEVERLLKRKTVVEKRLGMPAPMTAKAKVVSIDRPAAAHRQKEAERKKQEAAARKEAAEKRKQEAAARKVEEKARAEVKAKAKTEAEIAAQPSLFVISLRYLVPLEKIDAMLPRHVAYLDKFFAKGIFLVSGRMVPRTGGIIIASGKDRAAVERITKQDPFVKGKLADIDIVEFKAGKKNAGAKGKNRLI